MSFYSDTVLGDGPSAYWRFNDVTGPNFINDPSFELGTVIAEQTVWNLAVAAEFSIDGTTFLSGTTSLKCTTTRTSAGWNSCVRKTNLTVGSSTDLFSVSPGQQYYMSCWSKQTAGAKASHYKITWLDASGNSISNYQPMTGQDGLKDWTFYSGIWTVPSGAVYGQVAVMYGYWDGVTGTNAQIWFDDIQFAPITVATTEQASFFWNDYPARVLSDKPLGYWRLDDVATKAYDETLQGNTGSISGVGVTVRQPGALVNAQSWGMGFNGSTGNISTTGPDTSGTKSFSYEAWVKPTTIDTNFRRILGEEPVTNHGTLLYWQSSVGFGFARGDSGATTDTATGGAPSTTAWSHVVGTYDGVTMKLYVNGVVVGSTVSSRSADPQSTTFIIGGTVSNNNGAANIDEVAVYNFALSAGQVYSHYSTGTITSANGTLNGGVTTGVAGATRDGDVAMSFDGTTGYINVANQSIVNPSLTDFSVEFWMKWTGAGSDVSILEKWSGASTYPYAFRTGSGRANQITFGRYDGTHNPGVSSTVLVNDNAWHHVVGVLSGKTMLLYVDSRLQNTAIDNTVGSTANTDPLTIGARGGPNFFFTGSLDELSIYPYALTPTQVATHFASASIAWTTPVNGTPNTGTGLSSLPINADLALAETFPYVVNVGNYLASTDFIQSVKATLVNLTTDQPVSSWNGTIKVGQNLITVPINCNVLQLGQSYLLAITFTANYQKIMTLTTILGVVA